jgi:hypothetical protein
MFYTKCKKCGTTRRWLDREEVKDAKLVEEQRHKKLTQEEVDAAERVVEFVCEDCEPKKKKGKKAEAVADA